MSDPFATLVPDATGFLSDLARNNTRDWFLAHKPTYEDKLKAPAMALLDIIAADLGTGTGTKLFRAHRDVRFSKDKTPYHTHLHMLWSLPSESGPRPALFFGIGLDYVSVGAGFMGFDKTALPIWRAGVDGAQGAEIAAKLDRLAADGLRIGAPELKRVPAPYDKDHPQGALLRRKALTVWHDLDKAEIANPVTAIRATHQRLAPLLGSLQAIF
ncbi:TIGR02453 family protein [Ruegeria sp. 2012CJ41-6]|uniref:TIGR02453 family protein n=1 Tax=Ruegeria spongiae TaxID=2942209 RepID=A0ABT0Q3U8_9RHOB|nr:TIGR02453 family protein [Ruegeria spongiae]MCL6284467.1 TIGR02453 family protein [Ruegeria spongiae]